jgi:hypothetical protein
VGAATNFGTRHLGSICAPTQVPNVAGNVSDRIWTCPTGTWNGAAYVDSTATQARVYDANGQVTSETEDRHAFKRLSACGEIHFNIIECICCKDGAPSHKCPQAIASNFSAYLQGNKPCADASTKIAYEYAESKGSYMSARATTYKEFESGSSGQAIGDSSKPGFCQTLEEALKPVPICEDEGKCKEGRSKCLGLNGMYCKKTCNLCEVKKNHPICGPAHGDWASRCSVLGLCLV